MSDGSPPPPPAVVVLGAGEAACEEVAVGGVGGARTAGECLRFVGRRFDGSC
jgi:hypothetical protein